MNSRASDPLALIPGGRSREGWRSAFGPEAVCFSAAALAGAAMLAAILLPMPRANANPTFARTTGHTCAACHVPAQEPLLNATGEEFKSCGFSFCKGPPSATQAQPPRPQPRVAPAARNDAPEEKTMLGHNGSTIDMTRKGRDVTMTYSSVRDGLSARPGDVLFAGSIDGKWMKGTAFTFRRGCPPSPYDVSGMMSNSRILLRGAAPVRARSGCSIVGYDESEASARLEFDIAE